MRTAGPRRLRLIPGPTCHKTHAGSITTIMNAIIARHVCHLGFGSKPLYYSKATCFRHRATRSVNTMAQPLRPRQFAPLDPAKRKEGDERPELKGVVFDVDGTLCNGSSVTCERESDGDANV